MSAPIYKGGPPFCKPYQRFPNSIQIPWQNGSTGGVPTNGTTGTGAGKAGPGSYYIDFTAANNVYEYLQVGTKASPTWQPSNGPAVGAYARFALSSAQILALTSTPVTIVPAPGAGFTVVMFALVFEMITTSTAYANGATINAVYHGGSVAALTGSIATTVVTAGAGTSLTSLGANIVSTGNTLTTAVGVDLTSATTPYITGTGTAIVHSWYAVLAQ